jgi:hypothetical protein
MQAGGSQPAGSGRVLRLDPFALPVRFPALDAGADGQIRHVELDRERVVLRRAVAGIRMAVGVRISDFRGVVMRREAAQEGGPARYCVTLEHRDPRLSVPLLVVEDDDEVMAHWRAWGRVLGLPLLAQRSDGGMCEALPHPGRLDMRSPAPRRRRRSVLRRRRPRLPLRRKMGRSFDQAPVHRGEREIIARN